jgi:hypothetical protein
MNKIVCLFLLLSAAALFAGCFDPSNSRKYTISSYFTSFDSTSNKKGQRFKYSYEIYNSDSNMIYQELYADPGYPDTEWGKLYERSTIVYDGKRMKKKIRAYGLAFPEKQTGTVVYKYEYEKDQVTKCSTIGQLPAPHRPDSWNEQMGKKTIYDRLNRKKRIESYDRQKLMYVLDFQYAE